MNKERKHMFNKTLRHLMLLVIALVLAFMPSMQASAALVKCRTDPIFFLSNGDILTVVLDINADASNVRNVMYVLHVPDGVTVRKVTYTAGGLGTKETFKVQQDSPAKTYTTDTVVTTQNTGSIAVTATTFLNRQYSESVTGYNGTHLIVTVSKP